MEIKLDDNLLFKDIIQTKLSNENGGSINLIVRPECNQNCEYCYLYQYGKESYPIQTRKDNKTIINNIKLLMNYLIENNYYIQRIDLFAGDMFFDDLFFDIIKPIYDYYLYIDNNHMHKGPTAIAIPCNMSFCEDDEKVKKVEEIVYKFELIHVNLYFSYSTDGKYAASTREKKELSDEHFHKIFKICNRHYWYLHPMISHENISTAIQNYEWWKSILKDYPNICSTTFPPYAEVRNPGWTDDTIKMYEDFLIYVLKDIYQNYCNSDIDKFFHTQFSMETDGPGQTCSQEIFRLYPIGTNKVTCGLTGFDFSVIASDLRIVPCHRLAYPMLAGGYFKIENEKIVDIIAGENMNGYINIINMHNKNKPKCIICKYRNFCRKGCIGAQFEYFGEPYFSIPSVCELFERKCNTLVKFYHEIGLFYYLFEKQPNFYINQELIKLLLNLGYQEYHKFIKGECHGINC